MIGVIADKADSDVAAEFFELFKTPWEFYRTSRPYDVILCDGEAEPKHDAARLILAYSGRRLFSDAPERIEIGSGTSTRMLRHRGARLPIYGESLTFRERGLGLLLEEASGNAAIDEHRSGDQLRVRIGYNLFGEIRRLLTAGQPPAYAAIPTLERHIALLRDLILAARIPLIEIPPVPVGYKGIACLTHDVDHPSIRQHGWDRTVLGLLYRAVLGSLANLLRGRIPLRDLIRNWMAAAKLPWIQTGLAKDFWRDFADRYAAEEGRGCSTFFVLPFQGCPGRTAEGPAPAMRAAGYGAGDIFDLLGKMVTTGSEVGLHGIDAWCSSLSAHEEIEEIRRLTGSSEIGVRMHWLFYSEESPAILERAGASYDSTIGYRETVGYRAGTTQAYKPLGAEKFLELPLHVMDTALFFPAYRGLSAREATAVLEPLAENVGELGGCITVNWHDRSLAPERLWHRTYRELLAGLKNQDVWFATAGHTVAWFRKRRSVVFEADAVETNAIRARVTATRGEPLPGLRLRIHRPRSIDGTEMRLEYQDIAFDHSAKVPLTCEA